jgi:hypothetical protein
MYGINLKINRNKLAFRSHVPEFRNRSPVCIWKVAETADPGVVGWSQEAVGPSLVFQI